MRRKKIMWRIYASFLVSAMLAFAAMAWYATQSLRWFHQDQVAAELLMHARIVTWEAAAILPETESGTADRLCKELGRLMTTRITLILPDGRVIGDSEDNPAGMENHRNRPEITVALKGATGKAVRFSDTRRQSLMYLAIPVRHGNTLLAVARVSLPLSVIDWSLHAVVRNIILGWLIVAILFAVVTWLISWRISRPLEDMRRVAERIACGDLEARVARPDSEELGDLARTLNQMVAQLGERLSTITRQRNEQEAVLASMVEGVLAVDRDERILHLNHAAARLLDLAPEQARGRSIQEAVRNRDLQSFIGATLAGTGPAEGEIVIYGNDERFLQLHGTALTDITDHNIGALIVLNDITRLKRLETVRRDFVANVSHELKTPITALKGCVETLSDTRPMDPVENSRFLAMMARQVTRMEALVKDLLSLSQIEFDTERGQVQLEPAPVADVLRRAANIFTEQAEYKKIILTVDCPENLTASINAVLLEQAVGNLLDNAIKYSSDGTRVLVSAKLKGTDVEISVADQGPGIEKKHLDRIFERFYRVDQARSRAMGGTGLGLAIVKHIALAHRGTVTVVSEPGQGSTFTIRIPTRQPG
ncbi:MAG: HAMP domain-containing protein [Verrucomicrobia bacterium]|nr:HAMP domain-containing protein [Verrucomicrobiota bacterium]MBU4247881.1 HAMP domain-containing protein [Verrucomicrobiota bacterium]MBU4292245.1 HAMP domain-containing protein [Verrucomicrobiota bacterium]MBU4427986.1 HAMP domain-containing protein [Verrucomicrobiota bacterium]MBU4498023.1 HAMP domain-containing protein [Verrucomicrobiota bacterium]